MKYFQPKEYIKSLPNHFSFINLLIWLVSYFVSLFIISLVARKDVAILIKEISDGFVRLDLSTKLTLTLQVLLVGAIKLTFFLIVIGLISGIVKLFRRNINFWKIFNALIYLAALLMIIFALLFALVYIIAVLT